MLGMEAEDDPSLSRADLQCVGVDLGVRIEAGQGNSHRLDTVGGERHGLRLGAAHGAGQGGGEVLAQHRHAGQGRLALAHATLIQSKRSAKRKSGSTDASALPSGPAC